MNSDHPFMDGNKRAATAAMSALLRKTGYRFKPKPEELLSNIIGIAASEISFEGFASWAESNL